MTDKGWIVLHRCLLDKPIWQLSTPEQKTILITLLLMVNHEEKEWEWQGQKFKVKTGQVVTSLESIAQAAGKGISVKNVRTAIERFEKLEFLANQSTKTGRLITIVNWELYQGMHEEGGKDTGKEVAKTGQTGGKGVATNNNDNNDNNDNKIINLSAEQTPYAQILELFISLCPTLPKIKDITGNRQKVVKTRWKEHPDISFFKSLFQRVNASDFLSGRNDKWKGCCFDWIMKPANMQKIIEGNYDNKESQWSDIES